MENAYCMVLFHLFGTHHVTCNVYVVALHVSQHLVH